MKTIAFSSSNSSTSINHQLIHYAAQNIEDTEVIKLTDYTMPIYSEDIEKASGIPEAVKQLNEKLAEADQLIISLAEHNGNFTAFFKNTLDWLSRNDRSFLKDKMVLLLSTSPGPGGAASALALAEKTLPYFGAHVSASMSIGNFYKVFENGDITDSEIKSKLTALLNEFSA